MNPDGLLLHRYVKEGSQSAFTELVHRHLDLVYAAAMRRTGGDSHQSADVCQHVFISLAKNAGTLARHTAIGAWLHKCGPKPDECRPTPKVAGIDRGRRSPFHRR
jgi:hypothetical protein